MDYFHTVAAVTLIVIQALFIWSIIDMHRMFTGDMMMALRATELLQEQTLNLFDKINAQQRQIEQLTIVLTRDYKARG
jgi:hypothetical protein